MISESWADASERNLSFSGIIFRELTAVWPKCFFSMERGTFCLGRTFLGSLQGDSAPFNRSSMQRISQRHWQCWQKKPQTWLLIPKYRVKKFPSNFSASVGEHDSFFFFFANSASEVRSCAETPRGAEGHVKNWEREKNHSNPLKRRKTEFEKKRLHTYMLVALLARKQQVLINLSFPWPVHHAVLVLIVLYCCFSHPRQLKGNVAVLS